MYEHMYDAAVLNKSESLSHMLYVLYGALFFRCLKVSCALLGSSMERICTLLDMASKEGAFIQEHLLFAMPTHEQRTSGDVCDKKLFLDITVEEFNNILDEIRHLISIAMTRTSTILRGHGQAPTERVASPGTSREGAREDTPHLERACPPPHPPRPIPSRADSTSRKC
jgi:hypothetical protein